MTRNLSGDHSEGPRNATSRLSEAVTSSSPRGAVEVSVTRVSAGEPAEVVDSLAIEEPLETRLIFSLDGERQHQTIAITMRTPGNDVELALGYLFSEGIIASRDDFRIASHVGPSSERGARNTVQVELCEHVAVNLQGLERNFYTSSSCGVCGKTSLGSIAAAGCRPLSMAHPRVAASLIHRLPALLRNAQAVFESTGGIHAAALFDAEGELQCLREDVGRHNAVDKLIGRQLLDARLPAAESLLVLSGRASFELIQKASRAAIPVVVAIGAPSSLAVDLAKQQSMTLIGFTRSDRFNIYSEPTRIVGVRPVTVR